MNISRRIRVFLVLCGMLVCVGVSAQEYCELYAKECSYAMEFYKTSFFRDTVEARGTVSAELLFSVVAPEMTQYRHLRDKIEQTALFGLYAHNGRDYADFSIGIFQMKPSFIEMLEEEVRGNERLKYLFPDCIFSGDDTMPERRDRIKRLQSPQWQTRYLMVFGEIMERRFGGILYSNHEKLRLYATAYNSGFRKPAEELERMSGRELFPRFSTKKFNYASLAAWFYERLTTENK